MTNKEEGMKGKEIMKKIGISLFYNLRPVIKVENVSYS
jgi:hypothetical protein